MIWGMLAVAALIGWYLIDLPSPNALVAPRQPSVTVLADDGSVLANYGELHGTPLHYDQIPQDLVHAVVATEDRTFFSNFGIDLRGMARAAWVDLRAGRIVEGGSTITQQVAKNLFLTPERSFKRKIQEVLLALWLEHRFSKQQILTIYLNRVYLGAGTYGVNAAAHRYFGISARDLSLPQAALMAGLLQAPSRLSPLANPSAARERAAQVLDNMVAAGYLTPAQANAAKLAPLGLVAARAPGDQVRYATDWVVQRAADYIGSATSDLVITTTIDPRLQREAETAVHAGLAREGAKRHASQSALVTMAPDGAVRAMVGGADYGASQFNRAVQAHRQPGSAFKLFVYLAALEAGMTPNDIVIDQPVTIKGWSPHNFEHNYLGPVTLREALTHSINTVAAEVAWKVGMPKVIAVAHRLGITEPMKPLPSLALGTVGVSPLELTAAYAAVANQGFAAWPYVIKEIRTRNGRVLYRRQDARPQRVVPPHVEAEMVDMLQANVEGGTGTAARLSRPAAGKTGTSADFRDAWFVGFTRGLVTGVWVGNDDDSPMKRVTGGGLPAQIWADFMRHATAGNPVLALVDAGASQQTQGSGNFGNMLDNLFKQLAGGQAAAPDTTNRSGNKPVH